MSETAAISAGLPFGGVLFERARALTEHMLVTLGVVLSPAEAVRAIEATERHSWRQTWPAGRVTPVYAEFLWPCGHIQCAFMGGPPFGWHPTPIAWRPVYAPPGLVAGSRRKPLAGSVVGAPGTYTTLASTSE